MMDNNFTVKYINARNCFLILSESNQRKLSYQKVVKVKYQSKEIYCSCIYSSVINDDNIVGIPSLYAKDLGIRENETVYVVDVARVPNLTKITVTSVTSDDYEVLELSSQTVQSTLLDQIRVVNVNQKLTIWISKWLRTTVKVEDAEPLHFGYLNNLTEVHVLQSYCSESTPTKTNSTQNRVAEEETVISCEVEILRRYIKPVSETIYRVKSLETPKSLLENDFIVMHPFNIFIFQDSLPNFIQIDNIKDVALSKLTVIEPPEIRNAERKTKFEYNDIIVRVCVIEQYYNLFSDNLKLCFGENLLNQKYPVVYIPEKSMKHFDLVTGSKVSLCRNVELPSDVRSAEVLVSDLKSKSAVENFKRFLSDCVKASKCVLNSDICFDLDNFLCLVKFYPRSKYFVFDEYALRNCKIYENNETKGVFPPALVTNGVTNNSDKIFVEVDELKKIVQEAENLFKIKNQNENILITGRSGSGKTSLAKLISENVSKSAPYFYKIFTNCKRLKGKSVENLQKLLIQDFRTLTYYQPSVLILDDLDILCKNTESESDNKTQETTYSDRVSEMLADLIRYYQKFNRISIIATCKSYFEMNNIIISPRGQHIFKNSFQIPELNKQNRCILLNKFFKDRNVVIDSLNIEKMAVRTEGYVVQDLIDVVSRSIFEYYKRADRKAISSITLDDTDVDTSLSSLLPISLQSISFHSSASDSNISLADIGGLVEAKARLMENISWPGLYPELFSGVDGLAECPVKYARGTILFGPPGVGKTALVGAVARECQVRLIVVNGPELLSKYVGESERSVRNVFEKAHQARPCILFFDEFESAASRRGKDSTGVTDRVVNQLLVQLDGVEGSGGGVYVVAATSRPDLVDPALLRPGRLGLRVRCDVPDQAARLHILQALSNRLNLSTDVKLDSFAAMTVGYTGADLQAVLYTAQVLAVEDAILASEGNAVESVVVTEELLKQALSSTQPSLSNKEAQKYEMIYAKFQSKKGVSDPAENIKKQKTILA